ncbi:DUF1758 domain-containing protein [Trichonephila clavipes]|nr:DUF1758 domain-containing protein [Trichonephila clavipes]
MTFGVKCSPFLLAAVIRLLVEKYINRYKRACEMLNKIYVEDLINSTSDTTEALQLGEEMIHILSEAVMNLHRWATNSTTLHEAWKRANINCNYRETSEESGVPLKILGIIRDNVNDNLNFDIKQFEKLNNLVKVTKRVILSACGEEKVPQQLWRLGRIIEIHKGRDGKVRSATIKTSTGIMKRPVQLLYNLEIVNNE